MFPKHYTLKNDQDDFFELHDGRDDKSFKVAKKGIHPANQIKIMKLQKFADGGEVNTDELGLSNPASRMMKKEAPTEESTRPWYTSIGIEELPHEYEARMKSINPQVEAPQEQIQQESVPRVPAEQPVSPDQAVPQTQAPQGMPAAQVPQMGGMGSGGYEKAIMAGAQGQIDQNKQIADLQGQRVQFEEQRMAVSQGIEQDLRQKANQLSQDIATFRVDPEKFWNNKSAGSKFGTALSVILGGIGAGLQGTTQNAALGVLQKSIDLDIESQKLDLGKKQTLLSDNLRMQGDLRSAEAATRAQYESLFQGKLAQLVAKTNNPMIIAASKQQLHDSKMREMQFLGPLIQKQTDRVIKQHLSQRGVNAQEAAGLPDDIRKTLTVLPSGVMVPVASEKEATKGSDVSYRTNVLKANITKLRTIVGRSGTQEFTGPSEEIMTGLINDIATDYAKMVDIESIARPSEVEQAKASLFTPGTWRKSNKSVIKSLDAFEQNVANRALQQYKALGVPDKFLPKLDAAPTKTVNGVTVKVRPDGK